MSQYAYRNKLEYAWASTPEGVALGFHRAGRWEEIVPLEVCLLTGDRGNAVREAFVAWARAQGLEAYDQRVHTGYLRHLVVREGVRTGELLCILVTVNGDVPGVEELQALLAERAPGVVGVLHAVNDGVAEVASGIPTRPLFGRAWFEEEISGLRLRVSAGSFLQTNTEMADVLYHDAIEQAGLTGGEIVWDLYCGTGSIGLALAGSARRVIGVEIVPEAIERARENALANGVANIQFVCADAGKAPRDLVADGLPAPDVVVLDPPRAGMTPKAARRVAELGARRIVYVSCNPTTLAGNAPILAEGGYTLTRLRPFDLFPHTPHVECVACLRARRLVRRQGRVPLAERAERGPEAALRGGVVERRLERWGDERLDRRRQVLDDAELVLERLRQREVEAVDDGERVLAHHDHDLGLHDVQLAQQPHRVDAPASSRSSRPWSPPSLTTFVP